MLRVASLAILADSSAFTAADWRWAIFSVGICAILLTIGLIALGIFVFRNRVTERTLLYFGIFVVLYGVRLFLGDRIILSVFGISPGIARHIVRTITFTIGLASLSIILEVVQARWRTVFQWALAVQLTFTVLAILSEAFGVAGRAADIANNLLVLATWVLIVVFLFLLRLPGRMPRELRVFAFGLAIFGFFVLHANLASLHVLPGRDIEPVGFVIFVCSLGYLVAYRIFAGQESLFAIQKELEIAEQIQASILPRDVPRRAGIEIAARYLPMSAVAGDFYDFLTSDRNHLGILIADVTGHGVPAALIASMLKVAFASQSAYTEDPARVLTGLNQALCGKFEEHFVTAAYLYMDLDAKIIRYAGAGHPPLLFSSCSNGNTRSIEKNGYFLGMFPEAAYASIEMRMQAGDRYVLYTDGLPESKNASGEEFGIGRCLKVLGSHSRLSTAAFADRLLSEISNWTAQGAARLQEDDMTLIVIDCRA